MRYQLLIFDMDGTLTEERLNFAAIRRDIGIPEGTGILEHIARLHGPTQDRAWDILHHHEKIAAEIATPFPGAADLLTELRHRGITTALLTRNSAASAATVLGRNQLTLDHVASREHLPHKPHGDSILNIVRRFPILPEQTLMVGDYLYDLQAAKAAGVDAALVHHKGGPPPDFAAMATYTVTRLGALLDLL